MPTFFFHYEVKNKSGESRIVCHEVPSDTYEYARYMAETMLDYGFPAHQQWAHREMTPDEVNTYYEAEYQRVKALGGKTLAELAPVVDGQLKDVVVVTDDKAAICWQDDGTLLYASYYDGVPSCYYAPHTTFANNREDFTSLARFTQFLQEIEGNDPYISHLLNSPVWKFADGPSVAHTAITEFNSLLGDINIDL